LSEKLVRSIAGRWLQEDTELERASARYDRALREEDRLSEKLVGSIAGRWLHDDTRLERAAARYDRAKVRHRYIKLTCNKEEEEREEKGRKGKREETLSWLTG
jgi:hypothetical protein